MTSVCLLSPAVSDPALATLTQLKYDEVKKVVVKIRGSEDGAGIIVGVKDNSAFIMTAYHIIENASNIDVTFFDIRYERFQASIIGFNKELDIAAIRVDSVSNKSIPGD